MLILKYPPSYYLPIYCYVIQLGPFFLYPHQSPVLSAVPQERDAHRPSLPNCLEHAVTFVVL